jgi:glycosyltransferase involved in cell wall biosynthesis
MLESHLKLNLPRENLTFIPNFARFERKLNLNGINNLVHFKKYNLYFGRLSVEKGIHLIFKLAKDFPNENFVFVGDGPMKEQVPINLKNVQLISFQNGDNLINIIQNADLSLSPSLWYENSPLNVIESLNLGTPVLGSNIGGIPEFIENEVNGLLFEPNNYLDLKEKFRRFKYINPDNKISIKKILNVEEYTIIIEKLYKELI